MANPVLITSDGTTDLSEALQNKYNIKDLKLRVTLGDKEYIDAVTLTPQMIYDYYQKTGDLPKTASPSPSACEEFFRTYTEQGYDIVHFTVGSDLASSYNNACIAAQEFDNVYVVDSRNLSTGIALLMLRARDLANEGKSAAEIADACRDLTAYADASFVIDSLEFLHKGGRCSALAVLGANVLKIKPCILVRGGVMRVGKKLRGKFNMIASDYVKEALGDTSDIIPDHIFITHGGIDEGLIAKVKEQVEAAVPGCTVHVTLTGCTILSHCGQQTFGVLFLRKNPIS